MVLPLNFWILFGICMLVSSIGFKNYVWFISLGYGFSIAAQGVAMMIMYGQSLTPGTVIDGQLELLGDVVWDTKTNLEKRMAAEAGANADKMRIAKRAKELGHDAIHDTVHEMAKDEARHGQGFEGLYNRFFKK